MKNILFVFSAISLLIPTVVCGQQAPPKNSPSAPPFRLGSADMVRGDFEAAITDFGHAIDLDPKLPAGYNARGFAKLHMTDTGGAIADFNQAIALEKKFADAYYGRAEAEQMEGGLDAAMDDYEMTIRLSAEGASDNPHFLLWVVRVQLNQKDAADKELAAYMASRSTEPAHEFHKNIADYLLGKISDKEFLASTALVESVADAQKATCDVYYFTGMKLLLTGDKNGAVVNLGKCIRTAEMTTSVFPLASAQLKALGAKP